MELQGKRLVLGVTGGIAAYKAAELVRLLGKPGAEVQVAMTAGATHLVTATPLQAMSGCPTLLRTSTCCGRLTCFWLPRPRPISWRALRTAWPTACWRPWCWHA